mmetsp:Transcript_30142/g.90312  ORF Transcript_30142/g.90312 Transcript_30142/m.90312 type:complete len:235 (+) Transcript_30142:7356-8060(+)
MIQEHWVCFVPLVAVADEIDHFWLGIFERNLDARSICGASHNCRNACTFHLFPLQRKLALLPHRLVLHTATAVLELQGSAVLNAVIRDITKFLVARNSIFSPVLDLSHICAVLSRHNVVNSLNDRHPCHAHDAGIEVFNQVRNRVDSTLVNHQDFALKVGVAVGVDLDLEWPLHGIVHRGLLGEREVLFVPCFAVLTTRPPRQRGNMRQKLGHPLSDGGITLGVALRSRHSGRS